MRILFIGNSHTYYNDMPEMVRKMAVEAGIDCEVTMLAHGGWFLEQHAEEPECRFNILYGGYDYVVLQEHAHPFGPEERLYEAVRRLNEWIRQGKSVPVIYMTWAQKGEEALQERMTLAHRRIAEECGALLAPVGERWWSYQKDCPEAEMYAADGAHASAQGSEFAARCIWEAILADRNR